VAVNYEVHRGVSSDPGKGFDVPVNSFLRAAAEARRRNGRGSREPEFSTGDDVGAVNHVTELDSPQGGLRRFAVHGLRIMLTGARSCARLGSDCFKPFAQPLGCQRMAVGIVSSVRVDW
jgi:hypothetical protein